MITDYRHAKDYVGTCALLYAICSADIDSIATYDEKNDCWIDHLWNEKGNYVSNYIDDDTEIGVNVQAALERFGLCPPVELPE